MLNRLVSKFKFGAKYNYYGLERHGIRNQNIYYNLSVPQIYDIGILHLQPADKSTRPNSLSSTGAMVAFSGDRTGRSPKDKRIVVDDQSAGDIWWGNVNMPISEQSNQFCENLAVNYLNTCDRIYIVDGYAGWDPQYRLKIRIITTRSYHALFMRNMLVKPSQEELIRDFQDDNGIDFHVFNAGELQCPKGVEGVSSGTSVQVNFKQNKVVILGTQYAGEMKKGVFGIMHYLMPKLDVLSMHCSATEGNEGDVTLYFGLSGTGKTTLSADPKRFMLGDDEHCWSPRGIFNIEGGCYAKTIGLSKEKEPDIYNAIRFGSILENIEFLNEKSREVDYHNISITENTRCSYPLEHIQNAKFPSLGGHAQNIIFLTCDAFGVLPPLSKLTPEQAMYHFISGYTAKVAGTEMGIKDPVPTFSACFGEAFLPLHPTVYAEMLATKIKKHNCKVWLLNTGWSGGKYGEGKRMDIKVTRNLVDAIHSGELENVEWQEFPVFNFQVPKTVIGVDSKILNPRNTWQDGGHFDNLLNKLAIQFQTNFKKYESKASEDILKAAPQVNSEYLNKSKASDE